MSHPILVVCESPYDFDVCSRYIDRTIEDYGPDWAKGDLDAARVYIGINATSDVILETFVRWGHIGKVTDTLTERDKHRKEIIQTRPFGSGFPKHPYCIYFERFVNAVFFADGSQKPDAVVLLLDADNDENRRNGLQSLNTHYQKFGTPIAIGVPDPETECWELAGFEHKLTDEEAKRIDEVERDLDGVHPIRQSHRLHAAKASDVRHPKHVLSCLTCDVASRRKQCHDAPFDLLKRNGRENGLSDFLVLLSNRTIRGIFGGKRE